MDVSSIAAQGLAAAQANFQQAAANLSAAGVSPDGAPADTVELSVAAVGLLSARTQVEMNIKMLKVANEMDRQAISLLG